MGRFIYCINVYLRNMWTDDATDTESSASLPSYNASVRTSSAKAVYRRVREVLWMQWRGILIVVFILTDVVFFSVVFVYMNSVEEASLAKMDLTDSIFMPWLLCLVINGGQKDKCFALGQKALVNQPTVIAVLMLLAVSVPFLVST